MELCFEFNIFKFLGAVACTNFYQFFSYEVLSFGLQSACNVSPAIWLFVCVFPVLKQAPNAGKTAAALEEEARAYASRVQDVSKFSWTRYLRDAKAGSAHLVDAARGRAADQGKGISEGTAVISLMAPSSGPTSSAMMLNSPVVSPRPSPRTMSEHPPHKSAASLSAAAAVMAAWTRGGGGGSVSGDASVIADSAGYGHPIVSAEMLANALQAMFLCRTHLIELDDQDKAIRKRWWEATREWTWGYETQRRWDLEAEADRAAAIAADRAAEEEAKARAEAQAARYAMIESAATAATVYGEGGAFRRRVSSSTSASGSTSASTAADTTMAPAAVDTVSPAGGVQAVRNADAGKANKKFGKSRPASYTSSPFALLWNKRADRKSAAVSPAAAADAAAASLVRVEDTSANSPTEEGGTDRREVRKSDARWKPGSPPHRADVRNGVERTLQSPPPEPPRLGGADHTAASLAGSMSSVLHSALASRPSPVPSATMQNGARAGSHEDREQHQQQQQDQHRQKEQIYDWWREVWSQARLHRVTTHPLLLPMPSTPFNGFSVRGVRQEHVGNNTDGGGSGAIGSGGEEYSSRSPKGVGFSDGPWGGHFSTDEWRFGAGKWRAAAGGVGRTSRKQGSGAVDSISEADGAASPKEWTSSSQHSPVATHMSGSLTGAIDNSGRPGGIGLCAMNLGGASGNGSLPSMDRQPSQMSDSEDVELLRSRSATSSGAGRGSFDSNMEYEERSDRAASTTGRLAHTEVVPPLAARHSISGGLGSLSMRTGSGSSAPAGDVDSVNGGGGGGAAFAAATVVVDAVTSGGPDLRQIRSFSLAGVGDDGIRGKNSRSQYLRRKSSALDSMFREDTPAPAVAGIEETALATPSREDTDAERTAACAAALAQRFVEAYSAYLVTSFGFLPMEQQGTETVAEADGDSPVDARPARVNGEGQATTTPSPTEKFERRRDWGPSPHGDGGVGVSEFCSRRSIDPDGRDGDDGGDTVLARALLRLGLELSNTVVLVEVSVRITPEGSASTPVAASAPSQVQQELRLSESPVRQGTHSQQQNQEHPSLLKTLLACVKLWTIDVEEPLKGWGRDGPPGGYVRRDVDTRAREEETRPQSWWAHLPTLSSFKWHRNPNEPLVRGSCLPDELPLEFSRLVNRLRVGSSLDDFTLGQVSNYQPIQKRLSLVSRR